MKYISATKAGDIKPSMISAIISIISQPFFGKRNQNVYFGVQYPQVQSKNISDKIISSDTKLESTNRNNIEYDDEFYQY